MRGARPRIAGVALGVLAILGMASAPEAAFAASSPASWAARFCPAYATWSTNASALQSKFASVVATGSGGSPDPATLKSALVTLFADQAKNTATFVAALKAAGRPSSMNGAKISAELVSAFSGERRQSLALLAHAKKLDAANASRFKTQLAAMAKGVAGSAGTTAAEGLANLKQLDATGELDAALRANQSCVPAGSS